MEKGKAGNSKWKSDNIMFFALRCGLW